MDFCTAIITQKGEAYMAIVVLKPVQKFSFVVEGYLLKKHPLSSEIDASQHYRKGKF
jgi:hypothetical protein